MDEAGARALAQQHLGRWFIASAVQIRGKKLYVSYRPQQGDSTALGGNMPVEVDPANNQCRYINISEVFALDL
ncbi:hypothetical protein [Streptomyces sp. SPB4]|uniref:hypothetical protein n=1 Tax=Streptomyces sp. SPB4 TaxID=2940553 RepID=UPI002476323F|nr:hypothetical protein [Streptomyces sp. SPB4]MDH6543485.1 hypothetical protein [Streptomyces sp. SPB4]